LLFVIHTITSSKKKMNLSPRLENSSSSNTAASITDKKTDKTWPGLVKAQQKRIPVFRPILPRYSPP
jgi:hypothetical protein